MPTKITTLLDQKEVLVDFTDKPVTPWGGLVLFSGFAQQIGLPEALRSNIPFILKSPNATDPVEVILAFMAGVLAGSRRFSHIERLRQDEAVRTILGMKRFASGDTLARFCRRFHQKEIYLMFSALARWQLQIISESLPVPPRGYTLDLDSSAFERYGEQEGARKGYNPRKHGRPSHHPIFASIAETQTILWAWLRSGNTGSSRGGAEFLEEGMALLPTTVAVGRLRADSAFAIEPFLVVVERKAIPYAIAAKFTKGLQAKITTITEWQEIAPGIDVGETLFEAQGWTKARRVVIIRERKSETEAAKGRELFNDPRYGYRGIVTSKSESPLDIWRFYRGRADMENRIKETKYDYGINGFCLKKFYATEAAFRLVCFLHNLVILMQKKLGYVAHKTLGSLRYELLSCGAILGRAGNRLILRVSLQGPWREKFLSHLVNLFPSQNTNCSAVESG